MKIVMIGTVAASFYGFRADLIRTLLNQGHEIYALTSEYTAVDLKKIKQLGAIPVTYNLNRGGLNPLADIIATYQLSKEIKKIEPNLVFSFFSKPVIFGTLAAKLAKVPYIIGMLEGLGYTFTDQPDGISKKTRLIKRIQLFLYKIALPQLDQLIFLNPDDPKDLLVAHSISVKKQSVLGGIGLNLADYPFQLMPCYSNNINFLFIGRLLKEKGIHDFIAAIRIVKKTYSNTTFTVLGSIDHSNLGALSDKDLSTLVETGLIEYPGQVDNVKDWIAACHVFVLPSYREGVPRSTQEAMAMGRPIITTDVPGCRETVLDGVNGFIVEKWNPQALAEKMIYFIEHPEKLQSMGLASYQIAQERFDAKLVNVRLLKLLEIDG